MSLIEGDKVKAYLNQINAIATARSHEIRADGGNHERFDGIRDLTVKVATEIDNGIFDPDLTPKTPIKDIEVAAQDLIRKNDGDTSWEAALGVTKGKRHDLYHAIVLVLTKWGPQSDQQIGQLLTNNHIPFSDSGLRTRRSELVKAGWVRDSGTRTKTVSGGSTVVWEAVTGA